MKHVFLRKNVALGILALVVFHLRMDLGLLDPREIAWIWQADWATHYLGWLFFRFDEWRLPLGALPHYIVPEGTSVGLTDSIPIAAYFFKLFRSLLTENFQYFTWWYLLSLFLQGLFAYRLLSRFSGGSFGRILLATTVFVVAPPLMWRNWHIALCSQWILLWGFDLYFRSRSSGSPFRPETWIWLLIATGIHPYLCAMAFLIFLAIALNASRVLGLGGVWIFVREVAMGLGLVLLGFWLQGYFIGESSLDHEGFSYYSANLLTFFHPHDLPVLLPNLPHGDGQYEGFAYLGFGVLLMLLGVLWESKESLLKSLRSHASLVLVCVLGFLFALSSKVTLGPWMVLDLETVYQFLGPLPHVFRSSGRFAWPLYYLILLWVLTRALKTQSLMFRRLFPVLIFLQWVDVHRIVNYPRSPNQVISREEIGLLLSDLVAMEVKSSGKVNESVIRDLRIIDFGRPEQCHNKLRNHAEDWVYYPLLELAARNRWSTNFGLASRSSRTKRTQACLNSLESLQKANVSPGTLYAFRKPEAADLLKGSEAVFVCRENTNVALCLLR